MHLVGILGVIVLLLIAWGISYHRKDVKIRPIVWGTALQFLFAVIVLREDYWSFVGLGILALLITTFITKGIDARLGSGVKGAAITAVASLLVGTALYYAGPAIPWILALLVIFMIVNHKFKLAQIAQNISGAVFVVGLISWMVFENYTGRNLFGDFADKVSVFLGFADYGAKFLFSNLADGKYFFTGPDAAWPGFGFQFAFKVLPTIIFFGGFMSVMYYLGVMQMIISSMSKFMRWTLGTSGAETLSCTANIFVGQTEAPLLIKPFLEQMTQSEITTVMVGGFGTIAGGVLAGYISMGIPAQHLIAASVMAAPASLVLGKIIFPEKEHSVTAGDVEFPPIAVGGNVIEAASNGILDGFHLALNVAAMLIGFIALIALGDLALNWLDSIIDGRLLKGEYIQTAASSMSPVTGEYLGIFPGSFQKLFGTILKPIAFLIGAPWSEAGLVGNLLGIKLSLNEFVAYSTLGEYMKQGLLSEKSIVVSTYALCGFANFSSVGIQIGGISALAPSKKSVLAKVGLKAMIAGAFVSWISAAIASMLI